uniref:Gypsy retrotransposon integrase-like protein 1 n=1 Tax=Takifugu rubripes TaxID=31033 RepID=A0A674MXQ5_TAKRU
ASGPKRCWARLSNETQETHQKCSSSFVSSRTDAVRRTLEAQGRLLGQHDQLLTDIWTSLQTLNASVTDLLAPGRAELAPPPTPAEAPRVASQLFTAAPREPHVPVPERYSGEAGACASFLLQCSLVFDLQPLTYPSDRARIAFMVNLLSGRAAQWATAVLENQTPASSSFPVFTAEFRRVFELPIQSSEASSQILSLRQGSSSVADYSIRFRILAARSGWNDAALQGVFTQGLSDDLKDELAAREQPETLEALIGLATRLDNRLRERRRQRMSERTVRPSGRFSRPSETTGDSSAFVPECWRADPLPAHLPVRLTLSGTLLWGQESVPITFLVDSGADGNFISQDLARQARLPLETLPEPKTILGLNGEVLARITHRTQAITLIISGNHREQIHFFLIRSSSSPGVLGSPWLALHNPQFDWPTGRLVSWSVNCHTNCLRSAVTSLSGTSAPAQEIPDLSQVPRDYHDLGEVFSDSTTSPGRNGRPSSSPVGAGFFFVQKKDGTLRPCIDYRSLNEITIKNKYPLPLLDAAFAPLHRAKVFSKLDLRSAYHLVRIREGDEWKTAFNTPLGHFEYLVMPFGLTNAPAVFQALINDVLRDMLNKFIFVYLDDILIFSESEEEHVQHVRLVLQRLLENRLFVKAEKCDFHTTSISFLGFVVSWGQLSPDPAKVRAVMEWPTPSSRRQLQQFLGFANFYRRFIRDYSKVAAPLTRLTSTLLSFRWTPEAEAAFNRLKVLFSSSPILTHPDPSRQFVVEVDASDVGVGAVLSQRSGEDQKLHPCAFFSHRLSPAERNYDVGNKELLAVVLALQEWRHWLEGATQPFIVWTDHKNLTYLRNAKRLSSRQARWALFLGRFRFTLTYRPGSRNLKPDALSRQFASEPGEMDPDPILPLSCILGAASWQVEERVREAQQSAPDPGGCPPNRLFVPVAVRSEVLHWAHSSRLTCHPGVNRSLHFLRQRFWWPSMARDTKDYIAACPVCSRGKASHRPPAGLLQPLEIPRRPWSHIAVDFITGLPPSQGHEIVLTVVDRFSKSAHFIPLPKLPSAAETGELLVQHVFRLHGLPTDIVSDRGPQFCSQVWKSFCSALGASVSLTSGYHPQANGQAERTNQSLEDALRCVAAQDPSSWSTYLPWCSHLNVHFSKRYFRQKSSSFVTDFLLCPYITMRFMEDLLQMIIWFPAVTLLMKIS